MVQLYQALSKVETRGESTKIMAECLKYLENLITQQADEKVEESNKEDTK